MISPDGSTTTGIARRELLRRAALVGGASGVVGLALARGASAAAPGAPNPLKGDVLFKDPDFNFQASFSLGAAGAGAGEVGEVIATANLINARGLSFDSYVQAYTDLADRTAAIGDEALKGGHHVSAREASLRAAEYYAQALYFVLGTSRRGHEREAYARGRRQWDRFVRLSDPAIEFVKIPYEGTHLPAWFLRPDDSGARRPTVILTNGSDAQNVDMWTFGGAAALARGYNALIYEGPGQGSTLFERGIPFRPDWEKVITPIVDFLHRRHDVAANAVALLGSSFAGELVVRAAAFEHRLAAVVSDPGSVNTWLAYPKRLRELLSLPGGAAKVNAVWNHEIVPHFDTSTRFQFAKRTEIYGRQFLRAARVGKVFSDFYSFGRVAERFNNLDVIGRVRAPTLAIGYQLEEFYPGQYLTLYDRLRGPKDKVLFTVAEGAQYHDGPLAPQRHNQVIFDWLDDTLPRRAS